VVTPQPSAAEPVSAPRVEDELLPDTSVMFAGDGGMPEVPAEPELSQAPAPLVDEEFVPQAEAGEAEGSVLADAEGEAAQEDGDDPNDPDGKSRKSLAQKVRNWLGRAA
jgi:8-oxo-dGTP diphosphatase